MNESKASEAGSEFRECDHCSASAHYASGPKKIKKSGDRHAVLKQEQSIVHQISWRIQGGSD